MATLSYAFSNKPSYVGGTPLAVTISEIENAGYVGDVGSFTISTYIKVENLFYLQDSATVSSQVETTPGQITKLAEIVASSYVAGA